MIVAEEHEGSYKNGETPRYHTRDVAVVRARLEGARLLLGSATPSLETLARTEDGLGLLRLPEGIGPGPLPPAACLRALRTGGFPLGPPVAFALLAAAEVRGLTALAEAGGDPALTEVVEAALAPSAMEA